VITDELFAAFIRCKTKSYLTATAIKIDQNEAVDFHRRVLQSYKENCQRYLVTKVFKGYFAGNISPEILSSKQYSLIFDCALGTEKIQSRFHALQLSSAANGKPQGYIQFVLFLQKKSISMKSCNSPLTHWSSRWYSVTYYLSAK
jgi:hypothetical protein